MKTSTRYLLGVSIDEFNFLHSTGVLRVDGNRLVAGEANNAPPSAIQMLMAKMPEFMDSDEHGALILVLDLSKNAPPQICGGRPAPEFRFELYAEACTAIIPLTSLAKSILGARLGGQILLSEPFFENEMLELFKQRTRIRSIRGGDALVQALLDTDCHAVSDGLADACLADQSGSGDVIRRVCEYTRTKPMVREPISGLRDLGLILVEGLADKSNAHPSLRQLSEWLKPHQETVTGFARIYREAALLEILGRLTDGYGLATHAASLGIFLHWRELAIKNQGLDLEALAKDCRELAGCVPGGILIDALWLLGFNAGFETFAPAYYEYLPTAHPFAAKRKSQQRIALLWTVVPKTTSDESTTATDTTQSPTKTEESTPSTEAGGMEQPPTNTAGEPQAAEGSVTEEAPPAPEPPAEKAEKASTPAKTPRKTAAKKPKATKKAKSSAGPQEPGADPQLPL